MVIRHVTAEDPGKKRLAVLKQKPVLNAKETTEAIKLIMDQIKVK